LTNEIGFFNIKYVSGQLKLTALILISIVFLSIALPACAPQSFSERVMNVGLLLGSGGIGDKSFNDSAYTGLLDSQKKNNLRFELVTRADTETDAEALRRFARNNYDLIIGIAYENKDTIAKVAREFPGVKFAAIDVEVPGENIASVVYREQEGDFLIGVLAAMLTKTKYVGVIGGTDIPAIEHIMSGFKQGVTYQDNSVRVFTDFAGTFSDPQIGENLALGRYKEGADVIHNAASKTGLGIIQAAKETGNLTTGTSGDQRNLAPGNVVGNRPKRVDTAVEMLIDEVKNNTFKAGTRSLGLKENGIQLGPFDENIVTPAIMARLNELEQKIIDGQIVVQVD
jgi:basic membrane protein A and related proteins